ncbi:hypothetical protein MOQ_004250 [Trypanosoma cruzi marinkellei]|uniref:PH domain-containing protein n=1 Tax=Trypanosoma cruzi marinkellei TaxID=85056 RepID=K2NAK0_TRYCR|nr:hypothetical protein MOQ_004250 [Trypanosoma cruzi marinkellei]
MTHEQRGKSAKLTGDKTQTSYTVPERGDRSKSRAGTKTRRKDTAKGNGRVEGATHTERRIKVGETVYSRVMRHDESGAFGGGQVSVWKQEGGTVGDEWVEMTLESGDLVYAKWDNPAITRWQLPDNSSVHDHAEKVQKTFHAVKEWPEAEQTILRLAAAKALDECFASFADMDCATEVERSRMVQKIANEYMATSGAQKYDAEQSKEWLSRAAVRECELFLGMRHAPETAKEATRQHAATSLPQEKLDRNGHNLNKAGDNSPISTITAAASVQKGRSNGGKSDELFPSPSSPFLPRARFLRNPYYAALLLRPSARRGCIESRLEATTFAAACLGEIRVLCAVTVYEGRECPKKQLFAVARDWTGAFCFFVLEPFDDAKEAVVLYTYPLLGSVEMNLDSHQNVVFHVDGVEFLASFKDKEAASWLHDALKAAMASMYGEGNDCDRVVRMRAYSVEFASHYTSERDLMLIDVVSAILSATDCSDNLMKNKFAQLRRCLMKKEGRDKVALQLLNSMKILTTKSGASVPAASVLNHLRVVKEIIQCPTPYIDATLSQRLYEGVEEMGRYIPKTMAACSHLAVLLEYTDRVMLTWSSRSETPDVLFEPCFKPEGHSPAAFYEASLLEERRARGAEYRLPPGIYLAVICFCGERVFTNKAGGWIAEVVQREPTHEEIQQVAADSENYRWVLHVGGTDANWAKGENLEKWEALYKERGRESFKARFLRAARCLNERRVFPRLGCVFDTPIFQTEVGTTLILTLCEVESEATISPAAGVWRDISELELSTYTHSLMCSENARVAFLPTGYRRCVRYLNAALHYQKSLTQRLSSGFYVGFFLTSVSAEGALMLVPECNRNLPPLVKVSEEHPSLLQWRWLQSLNYRKKTTQTFGLPTVADISVPLDEGAPFESKVGYAIKALETAVGLKIQQFYDLELFALDEEQTIQAFFAVSYYPPPLQDIERVPEPPKGIVPMTFKLVRLVDDHHQRRYWSGVYGFLADEADRTYRMLCSTTQPFTSDDSIRLNTTSETMFHAMDLDKYALLFSWARTLAIWVETDGRTLVQRYAGQLLRNSGTNTRDTGKVEEVEYPGASLSVEEVVDVALSNQAAATDPKTFEMKSLLLQLRSAGKKDCAAVLQRLREMEDAAREGCPDHIAQMEDVNKLSLTLRGFDDAPPDGGFVAARSATEYELPCTLMEFVSGEDKVEDSYLFAREIVEDLIELAAAGGAVADFGRIAETMVSCVEAAENMVDGAALEALRVEAEEKAWAEREQFIGKWIEMFSARPIPSMFDEALVASVEDPEPLFHAGSSQCIGSCNDGLRVCLARAATDATQLQELLRVANSALHGLELAQCLHAYNDAIQKSEKNFFSDGPGKEEKKVGPGKAATANISTAPQKIVTLVSKERREVYLHSMDPLRCLLLQGEQPRVLFPEIGYAELKVLGDHMNAPEQEVAAQLRDMRPMDERERQDLLNMSIELQAPLIAIRLLPLVYCSETGHFGEEEANGVRKAINGMRFLFLYGVRDWLRMESLGGPAVVGGFDVLWWLRYLQEVGEGEEAYCSYSGSWKQLYAESRIRVLLSLGVGNVTEEELLLWMEGLGRLVAYMSFKGKANVTDAEVKILIETCPLLQSLDLSGTNVTDESVRLLCSRCKRLQECSVTGCRISREAEMWLNDLCRKNAQNL